MANIRIVFLAAALAAVAACASKNSKPAETPAPVAVKNPESAPAPKPAEVAAPIAEPAKPEAPNAVTSAPVTPATPAPTPPPPAVEPPPKKKRAMALGLPAVATLKDEVGMDRKQLKKCKEIYDAYKTKLDDATAKVKASQDKKATNKEVAPLRAEVLAKLREVCTDDAQRTRFDQATGAQKKKAAKT
jgi:hypothetical protein